MHNQTNNTSKQEATMISFNVFYGLCMKSVKKYPSFKTQITNHKPHKFTYKSCLYDLYYKIYILKNIVTAIVPASTFLISTIAIENTITLRTSLLAFAYFILMFAIVPAIADVLDYEEDMAFNIKTIGNTLSWKNTLILFNIGVIVAIASVAVVSLLFNSSYIVFFGSSAFCILVMAYSFKLRNESGLTASYKLRPVGFAIPALVPLFWTLGALL